MANRCIHGGPPDACVVCKNTISQAVLSKQFAQDYIPEHIDIPTAQAILELNKLTEDKMVNQLKGQELNEKYQKFSLTPRYYYKEGTDLYDMEIKMFGLNAWLRHVEMEAIQYIARADLKGHYREDIEKAKIILERILTEIGEKHE